MAIYAWEAKFLVVCLWRFPSRRKETAIGVLTPMAGRIRNRSAIKIADASGGACRLRRSKKSLQALRIGDEPEQNKLPQTQRRRYAHSHGSAVDIEKRYRRQDENCSDKLASYEQGDRSVVEIHQPAADGVEFMDGFLKSDEHICVVCRNHADQ